IKAARVVTPASRTTADPRLTLFFRRILLPRQQLLDRLFQSLRSCLRPLRADDPSDVFPLVREGQRLEEGGSLRIPVQEPLQIRWSGNHTVFPVDAERAVAVVNHLVATLHALLIQFRS